MTRENLEAYVKSADLLYPDMYSLSSSGVYRDTLEIWAPGDRRGRFFCLWSGDWISVG